VPLKTDLFDYELPDRLIAQTPAGCRDESRLLVVDRRAHTIAHFPPRALRRRHHRGSRHLLRPAFAPTTAKIQSA